MHEELMRPPQESIGGKKHSSDARQEVRAGRETIEELEKDQDTQDCSGDDHLDLLR